MILRQIAGLPPDCADLPDTVRARAQAILVTHAELFLQAGGTLTLSDWAGLDDTERAAFVSAGKRREVDRALRYGNAARGKLDALRVLAEVDGGASHDDALLRDAVARLAGLLNGGNHGAAA